MSGFKEQKVPLGNELFASVNLWNGVPLVHIRHFKTVTSPYPPHKTVQIPTKSGICMNEKQFKKLIVNLPTVIAELDKVKTSEVTTPPASTSQKTPMRTPNRASFDGKQFLHRAPAKLKTLAKRMKFDDAEVESTVEDQNDTTEMISRTIAEQQS